MAEESQVPRAVPTDDGFRADPRSYLRKWIVGKEHEGLDVTSEQHLDTGNGAPNNRDN